MTFRAGASEEGRVYGSNTMVFALGLNVLKLGKVMWLLFLEAAIALISLAVVALRKRICGAVALIKRLGLLAMACLLPYVWHALAANHSVIHAQNIAYRTQVITLFALSAAIVLVVY